MHLSERHLQLKLHINYSSWDLREFFPRIPEKINRIFLF